MMTRCRQSWLMMLFAAVCCSIQPHAGMAQFDFLKSLFRPQSRFEGYGQLAEATQHAQQGDIAKSLNSVREAFKKGGAKEAFDDPDALSIAQSLVSLSKLWAEKNAPPKEVAEVLQEIVLPSNPAGAVVPYATQWRLSYDMMMLSRPNARLVAPESVSEELVQWSVLAKQTDALRQRLQLALESPKHGWLARVVGVQLAVAEKDVGAANLHLQKLAEEAKKLNGAPQLEMLCHAVMAAVRNPQTGAAGLHLFEAVLDRADATLPQEAGLKGNSAWLRLRVARQHVQAGRSHEAVRLVNASVGKPINYERFSPDYLIYLRHMQIQQAAAVLLEGGFVAQALEILGPISEEPDLRAMRYEQVNVPAMLGRELQKLSAEARFELLRNWVIPRGDRNVLRDLSDFVPLDAPPENKSLPSAGLLQDIYSTGWHLLVTAKEIGKLDEVIQDLAAVSPQTPRVETLRTLGAVLRDGSANAKTIPNLNAGTSERLQKLLEATILNLPKQEEQNKAAFPMLTFVVAAEAARHPQWHEVTRLLLERLIDHSQRIQWDRPRPHVRITLTEMMRLRGAENREVPRMSEWMKLQPQHWVEAGIQSAAQNASGSLPGSWFALDGYVQHLAGAYDSELSFEYPLTGKFELTFDCREGGWAEGNAGYGGVQFVINAYSDTAYLIGKGRSGYDSGPNLANLLHKSSWNRYTIQVDGDVVRYLANGQFIHEDKLGAAAPWLTLGADWGRTPIFRNFKLTGTPTIPREIRLLTSSRLRGWVASYYEESRPDALREPQRYVQKIIEQNGQQVVTFVEADETNIDQSIVMSEPEADWSFENGELVSPRRKAFWPGVTESWFYYQRPLRNGDTLEYEFFYQPGQFEASPTIGRVAYEFGAEGLTRHRLTDGPSDVFAMSPDNGAQVRKNRRLKENEWNNVEIIFRGQELTIFLNGEVVTVEELNANDERRFGFYHDSARTSLRVRNAVLTGDWPTNFDDKLRSAIERPEPIESVPNARFLNYAINEERISDNAYEVYRKALTLPAKARYEFLHQWVMPDSSHDLLRMAGAFTPTHPAPPVLKDHPIDVAMATVRQTVDQRFIQTGGNFVCPAILLVLSAAETNRLEELKQEVLQHPPTSSTEMARSRAAMLGMIALFQNRPDETVAALWECSRLISDKNPSAQYARWGDVALASLAIQHPMTQVAAYELLDRIQRMQLQGSQPGTIEFGRFVRQLHGQVHYLMYGGAPDEFGAQPRTKQWRMVPQPSARSRGDGYPIASFDTVAGEMAIRGGHDCDLAYFQSPLHGNYEVTCQLSHLGYRETMLMAAGIANGLRYTQAAARVMHVRTKIVEVPTPKPISPKATTGFDYKISVRNGRFTSYVNGQEMYTADLPEQPDPWLAVLGLAGNSSRFARNIVITGNPEIPSELNLLAAGELKGWMTDYYGNALSQSPFAWAFQDGVLMCDQTVIRNARPGRLKVENIIRYHRPMLEDGEISYEFFYDPDVKVPAQDDQRMYFAGPNPPQRFIPGKTVVHPALDRMVCLLEADGVKIHWLTDGRFDRTGLAPGNVSAPQATVPLSIDAKDRGTLPLKPREWNAIKLATKGDTLTIDLNGQLILSHSIEPTNLRHFGLFHYANESGVRVRNIRYRGDWPKTLPSVDQQELAVGPESLPMMSESQLPETKQFDFTDSKFELTDFAYHFDAKAEKYVRPTAAGLHFQLPTGETKLQSAGIHPKLKLSGDFSVTIGYAGLRTVATKDGWGTGLSFKVMVEKSYETGLEAREAWGSKAVRAMWRLTTPLKDYHDESRPGFAESGRMRLQRRGSVLYYFVTEKGPDDFRLVAQRPIGTNDIQRINIQADASDQVGGAEFILKNLSIRATKISLVE